MSDTSIASNEARDRRHGPNHDQHRRKSDKDKEKPKPIFHHNHYRSGSIISSYTAVNAPTGLPPHRTTHFKHCEPKHIERNQDYFGQTANKRIEIVIKQVPPVYATTPPPQQQYPYTPAAPVARFQQKPKAAYIVERQKYIERERDRDRERQVREQDRDRDRVRRVREQERERGREREREQERAHGREREREQDRVRVREREVVREEDRDHDKEKRVQEQYHDRRETKVREQEPIYVPPPAAKKYETLLQTEEEKPRVKFDVDGRRLGRAVQPQQGLSEEKKGAVSEGTGKSMSTVEPEKVTEGTDMDQSMFQVEPSKVTEGTGASMNTLEANIMQQRAPVATQRLREEIFVNRQTYAKDDQIVGRNAIPVESPSVLVEDEVESTVEVKDVDLCPLCHKGWYVRKFTWSGIVAAIFCFPCGIIPCFKMRVYVCSFCGEQPVGEYKEYKEKDMPKVPGNSEDSWSRIVPPQRPDGWRTRA